MEAKAGTQGIGKPEPGASNDILINYLDSQGVHSSWGKKLSELSSVFSGKIPTPMSFSMFSTTYRIITVPEGDPKNSCFTKAAFIEEGVINCEVSHILVHPSVILLKKCLPPDVEIDQITAESVIDVIKKLDIKILVCVDEIPQIIIQKLLLNRITAIHNVPLSTISFIRSFSGLPLLDSFATVYDSVPKVFFGYFYAYIGGFDPLTTDGVEITDEMKTTMRLGLSSKQTKPNAVFVHSTQNTIGTFILRGATQQVEKCLRHLLNLEFNKICKKSIMKKLNFSERFIDDFHPQFPFALIHVAEEGFSQCTPYLSTMYSKEDLSLRYFLSQSLGAETEKDEKILFPDGINESIYKLETDIAFRLLHSYDSLTFYTFQARILPKNTKITVFKDHQIQLDSEQILEMSFTAFARMFFHINSSFKFIICVDGRGILVVKKRGGVCYGIAQAIKPVTFEGARGPFERDNCGCMECINNLTIKMQNHETLPSKDKLRIDIATSRHSTFRLFANLLHTAEVILAHSISKCSGENLGLLFPSLKSFIDEFGRSVQILSERPDKLLAQFFFNMYKWSITIANFSEIFKDLKIPESYSKYVISAPRYIIIKFLTFIEFRNLEEAAAQIGKEHPDVSCSWLFDRLEGKRSKHPTSEEYLGSFTRLLEESAANVFHSHILSIFDSSVNITFPLSLLGFALSSELYHNHVTSYIDELTEQQEVKDTLKKEIFSTKLSEESLAAILSGANSSQPFTIEINEVYPGEIPFVSDPITVELQCPAEFQALMASFGYGLAAVCFSLKSGKVSETSGGKSEAKYYESSDGHFLMKTISAVEYSAMPSFLPAYFRHILGSGSSTICRTLAAFTVTVGGRYSYKCILMENLRCGFGESGVVLYDFKGSLRNRTIADASSAVQLDTNYEQSSVDSRVVLSLSDKASLMHRIRADAAFLASHNIMDYSLVAVVSRPAMVVRAAIIDFFRPYTLDKALETWVKKTPLYSDHNIDPTVISPDSYRDRFVAALDKYFYISPRDKDAEAVQNLINCL